MRQHASRLGWIMVLAALGACDEPSGDEGPAAGGSGAGGKADDANAGQESVGVAVTASTVEALSGDVSSLRPEVREFSVGDPLPAGAYLRPMSALGHYGPIGPYGPLGVLGPVGDDVWNASTFVDIGGPWSGLASELADVDGPLSAAGPLGHDGPLNRDNWPASASENDLAPAFAEQLEPGGVFAVLGPAGPLGALGPLGPLGPVGAHGYVANARGEWTPGDGESACTHSDEHDVCRTVQVPWDASSRREYDLVEHYDEAFAQGMTDNDTSFMVTASLDDSQPDAYAFVSNETQVVTVLVLGQWTMYDPATAMGLLGQAALRGYRLPSFVLNYVFPYNVYNHDSSFDDFDLTLAIDDGETTTKVKSDSVAMVDWISVVVPAGATLSATVALDHRWSAPWRVYGPEYRLVVVGSTPSLAGIRVAGDHQVKAE